MWSGTNAKKTTTHLYANSNFDLDMFLTIFMRCKYNFDPHVKVLCKAKISISLNECASTITVTNREKAVVEAHREC